MKCRVLVFGLAALLALAGCTGGTAPQQAGGQPLRVAAVLPSATTDMAWSQSMFSGLKSVQQAMGGESAIELKVSENMVDVTAAAAALRDYAAQGYDIVIAHGSQYSSSVQEIARDFPKTTFALGNEVDTFGLPNVYAYTAAAEQGGYVNGVMAARLSASKLIGLIGPVEVGHCKFYADGFTQGVAATDSSVEVSQTWTESFSDVVLATEAARGQIAAGADVLTGMGQAATGPINAAKENGDVLWFGNEQDQASLAPSLVVACQVYDWTGMIKDLIAVRKSGRLGGDKYALTMQNGGLSIAFNPGYALPAEVKAAADKAIEEIKSGAITVTP
jgi:basic membrane lipoprotein Med (substrate-binding protein (PBP1-ABC) superfamily)